MTKPLDPEMKALRTIRAVIDPLDVDALIRIATWLTSFAMGEQKWHEEERRQEQIETAIAEGDPSA